MHSGIPTVVSRFGCVPDVLADRRTAMVIPIGDVPSLRDAIATLRDDEPLRRSVAGNALALAREQFTAAAMAAEYDAVFSGAVRA
jgi:glycosyltransferase involved in cell wall biosynthesis